MDLKESSFALIVRYQSNILLSSESPQISLPATPTENVTAARNSKMCKTNFVSFLSFRASQVVWAGVGRQKVAPKTQNLVHFIFICCNISSVLSDPRRSLICLQYLTMLSPVACPSSPNNCLLLQRSYDWNYNLNRHLKYECGKENAFMCSKCGRRFPHKQNCVYHLKRKHKIVCESVEQYVSNGLVVFTGSGTPGGSSLSPPGGHSAYSPKEGSVTPPPSNN